jgi:diguanylate cyclase (GGDEF)-like protein
LCQNKRQVDFAGRYGGEEFTVVLLDTDTAGGRYFAERLRRSIAGRPVVHEGKEIRFTVSLGLAELDASVTDPGDWISRADQALYAAKTSGRNRVMVFGDGGVAS